MPYLTPWTREKCKVLERWEEPVTSGSAKGIRGRVRYLDKKGKEVVETSYVKWNIED